MPLNKKPQVGVSQCLLGDAVRYDGKSKANDIVLKKIKKLFDLIPICPEVEAGLGVPRPPVQLTGSIENPNLTGRDDAELDVTRIMQKYCETKVIKLGHLSGFIFKSHSPSCGLNSTPVFINNHCVTKTGRGIFAKQLHDTYPDLIVIEDSQLEDEHLLNKFIQSISNKP